MQTCPLGVCLHDVSEMAGTEQQLQAQASLANQPWDGVDFFLKIWEKKLKLGLPFPLPMCLLLF